MCGIDREYVVDVKLLDVCVEEGVENEGDIVGGEVMAVGDAGGGVDVAMTRKVVRSKRITSVALQA